MPRCNAAMQTSASRPYAVVPAPAQQMVLLAVDPGKLPKAGAAAAEAAQQAAAAVGAPSAAEEFDANPRTMQQAVDNLARFTSDKPAGADSAACNQPGWRLPAHELTLLASHGRPRSTALEQRTAHCQSVSGTHGALRPQCTLSCHPSRPL